MNDAGQRLAITELDPFDDEEFAQWHAVYDAADRYGRESTSAAWGFDEARTAFQERTERKFRTALCGRLDGRMVAVGQAQGDLRDNLHLMQVEVFTEPTQRRQGHGSQLLARLEDLAHDRGRTTLISEVAWPLDGHPEGVGQPYVEFARRHGYAIGLVDIQRQLPLPVAARTLDRLADEAAPHHAAYTLRSWVGRVPDELVEGWVEVTSSLMTEAPLGEIDREPQIPDVPGFRESEELVAAQGRDVFCTAALDAQGTVVAFSDMAVSRGGVRAYQWGTLVRGDHRGHRLGVAVKAANLRQFQATHPDVRSILTWNAEVNSHMIGVNEQLGFVPTERLGEVQKRL